MRLSLAYEMQRPVVDDHAVIEETIEQVRLTGPAARRALKRDLNRQLPPLDTGMFQDSLLGEECLEGFRAFAEKRRPRWGPVR